MKNEGVKVMADGREKCNLLTAAGRAEYQGRKRRMWLRQGKICCLSKLYSPHAFIADCPGRLNWADAVFAHEIPKGYGGGSTDDRTDLPDGRRQNGAAHSSCNLAQGSRRVPFNAVYNNTLKEKIHAAR